MKKSTIFIHIPKTGGTSINCELNNTDWQTKPDFYYRHIIYETKKSNSSDIFDIQNFPKFKKYNIFMILRDPIERLFSEYYFLKDRTEFFSLLTKKPKSFYEYCLLPNTQNSIIKFLQGDKIYANKKVLQKDFNNIIKCVKEIPISIGIFEKYEKSLSYLASVYDLEWNATIQKKRITINKPQKHDLNTEQINDIKMLNSFDYQLYQFGLEQLSLQNFDELDINIVGSKYDYILKYTERFILIESFINNKTFLKNNSNFLIKLNLELHKKVRNGKEYVELWNKEVVDVLSKQNEDLKTKVNYIFCSYSDPLVILEKIANLIDSVNDKYKIIFK